MEKGKQIYVYTEIALTKKNGKLNKKIHPDLLVVIRLGRGQLKNIH